MSPGLPKFTRYMNVNVQIPEAEAGPVNVGRYLSVPTDLTDKERGPLLVDVKGRLIVKPSPSVPDPAVVNPKKYEGSVATVGVPVTLDVNDDLEHNSGDGYIVCDGPGDLEVDLSYDGSTFEEDITVKTDEILDLGGLNIDTIKIDVTQDGTAYRVIVI